MHFWLTHAWLKRQSVLVTHSGRHDGGEPMYPTTQEQIAWLLNSRQMLFGPQGDGRHGLGAETGAEIE